MEGLQGVWTGNWPRATRRRTSSLPRHRCARARRHPAVASPAPGAMAPGRCPGNAGGPRRHATQVQHGHGEEPCEDCQLHRRPGDAVASTCAQPCWEKPGRTRTGRRTAPGLQGAAIGSKAEDFWPARGPGRCAGINDLAVRKAGAEAAVQGPQPSPCARAGPKALVWWHRSASADHALLGGRPLVPALGGAPQSISLGTMGPACLPAGRRMAAVTLRAQASPSAV